MNERGEDGTYLLPSFSPHHSLSNLHATMLRNNDDDSLIAAFGYKMKFSRHSNNAHGFSSTKHLLRFSCDHLGGKRKKRAKVSHCVLHLVQHRRSMWWESGEKKEMTTRCENFFHDRAKENSKFSPTFVMFNCSTSSSLFHTALLIAPDGETLPNFCWGAKENYENSESLISTATPEHSTENIPKNSIPSGFYTAEMFRRWKRWPAISMRARRTRHRHSQPLQGNDDSAMLELFHRTTRCALSGRAARLPLYVCEDFPHERFTTNGKCWKLPLRSASMKFYSFHQMT